MQSSHMQTKEYAETSASHILVNMPRDAANLWELWGCGWYFRKRDDSFVLHLVHLPAKMTRSRSQILLPKNDRNRDRRNILRKKEDLQTESCKACGSLYLAAIRLDCFSILRASKTFKQPTNAINCFGCGSSGRSSCVCSHILPICKCSALF